MTWKEGLMAHYRRQRTWTWALIESIAEEHFDWRPAGDAFSCGEIVRHLAQSDWFWSGLLAHAARGEVFEPFPMPQGDRRERMESFRTPNLEASSNERFGTDFASALAKWSEVQEGAERAFEAIPEEAFETEFEHPLTRLRAPLWQMFMMMMEHEAHHRGQLSAYLKVIGAEQPADALGR